MSDCISCYNGLNFINSKNIQLPLFAVFKSSQRRDSLDIDYKLGLGSKGIQPLFSDALYKELNAGNEQASSVFVFDQNGKKRYTGNLKQLTNTRFIDSLATAVEDETQAVFTKWTPSYRVTFDPAVNTTKIYRRGTEETPLRTVNARDFRYSLLRNTLRPDRASMFDQVGKKLSTASNMAGYYSWAEVDTLNNVHVLLNYHNARKDSDTSVVTTDDFAIVTYDTSGAISRVLPFYETERDTENQYTGRFVYSPGIGYLTPTHYWKRWFQRTLEETGARNLTFLSLYTEKGKELLWDRKAPLELPPIYRQKYFENYLSTEYCQYPIMAFPLANQLYNLATGTSTYLMDNSAYLQRIHQKKADSESGNHDEPFELRGLNVDATRQEVYTVTRLDTNYFLNIHSLDLKLKKQVPLPVSGLARVDAADVDVYEHILYLRDIEAAKYIALPLAFFQ